MLVVGAEVLESGGNRGWKEGKWVRVPYCLATGLGMPEVGRTLRHRVHLQIR